MATSTKVVWAVIGGVMVVVIGIFSSRHVERTVAPEPKAAWVAVEVDDSGLARTGHVEIAAGTSFRLHAVVAAETWRGKTVYYSEAESLEIDGQRLLPGAVRRWQRASEPRILWFSVEGFTPFMEVDNVGDLERFRFEEVFRPDWPRAWSIPGDLRNRRELASRPELPARLPRFGTQRYHVRVEVFGPQSRITPRLRLQSLRAQDLPAKTKEFTTVVATLPGALQAPSRVFGLTQIEPAAGSLKPLAETLLRWSQLDLAFSRLTVLRDQLAMSSLSYDDLRWESVDLEAGPLWGEQGALGGDLLRVGDRWVVLVADRGQERVLDSSDLCFDFDKGAMVRKIGEVFTGEGLVEWARVPALGMSQTG